MSKSATQLNSNQQPVGLRLRPIAAAISTLMLPMAAFADDAAPAAADAPTQTVVVTGIRHAIETSVQAKRNSESIVEVISAEDIGKLPDVSIAESIARLPGLAAQRVDGRAQVISVRGMAPKYGVTLLNGREVVSTGDNRSVEYDQFPSELMNQVMVYKTPDASLVAVGLSGTVDMRSVRPLEIHERQVNVSVRGEKNSNGKLYDGSSDLGNRVSGSYVNQFANNTVGVAFAVSHLDSPGQEKYYKSWWWQTDPVPGVTPNPTSLHGFEAGVSSSDQKRDGVMGVLEFKPNKDFHSMVDLYYTTFKQTSNKSEIQAFLEPWGWSPNGPVTYTNPVVANGTLVGGTQTFTPTDMGRYTKRDDDVFAIGWNNELKRDKWTLTGDLSYSKAHRKEYDGELSARLTSPMAFQTSINTSNSGPSQFVPSGSLSDPATMQLQEQWGRVGLSRQPDVKDELKTLRLSAKRELDSWIDGIDGGVSFSERTKDMHRTELQYNLAGGAPVVIPSSMLHSPSAIPQVGVPGVLAWNFNSVLNAYTTASVSAPWNDSNRIWSVDEKNTTAYAKASFDVDASVPVKGNFGVQVVSLSQKSTGMFWDGHAASPISSPKKTRTDVLPSLNTVFDLAKMAGSGAQARVGLAEEIARPNMEDMRAGCNAGLDATSHTWSGTCGNPDLDPWRAVAFDAAIEKYFGKRSYVSLAYFHKDLKSFVYNQTNRADFSGYPNTTGIVPVSNLGNMTTPTNGTGGTVAGVELSASLEGHVLNDSLDGFGMTGSVSATRSALPYVDNNGNSSYTTPMEGMSGRVWNAVFYYEKNGYSARIGERYRSKFTAKTVNPFGDVADSAIGSERIVDMQIGYSIETGPYKGLSVLFQVNNLTDEPYTTYGSAWTSNATMYPERYTTYGKQYLLGLTYKM